MVIYGLQMEYLYGFNVLTDFFYQNYHSFNKSFVEPRLFGLSTWYVIFDSVFGDGFSFPDDVSDAVLFEVDLYLPNFSPKASVSTEGLKIS